jgi:hypothetical protein
VYSLSGTISDQNTTLLRPSVPSCLQVFDEGVCFWSILTVPRSQSNLRRPAHADARTVGMSGSSSVAEVHLKL